MNYEEQISLLSKQCFSIEETLPLWHIPTGNAYDDKEQMRKALYNIRIQLEPLKLFAVEIDKRD